VAVAELRRYNRRERQYVCLIVEARARSTVVRSEHECTVTTPYRLDLTVSVLRRLSSNLTDVLTPEGEYLRALGGLHTLVIARVTQRDPTTLAVSLEGDEGEHSRALAAVRKVLGVDRDLAHFDRAAARIRWLQSLAKRMHGVRPPRYPTLWEACVNAVVFQQISLVAATAIMRRLILALGQPFLTDGFQHFSFPTTTSFLATEARHAVLPSLASTIGRSAGGGSDLRRLDGSAHDCTRPGIRRRDITTSDRA
jgi:hypothetical protein